jgi:hypothetical protein
MAFRFLPVTICYGWIAPKADDVFIRRFRANVPACRLARLPACPVPNRMLVCACCLPVCLCVPEGGGQVAYMYVRSAFCQPRVLWC